MKAALLLCIVCYVQQAFTLPVTVNDVQTGKDQDNPLNSANLQSGVIGNCTPSLYTKIYKKSEMNPTENTLLFLTKNTENSYTSPMKKTGTLNDLFEERMEEQGSGENVSGNEANGQSPNQNNSETSLTKDQIIELENLHKRILGGLTEGLLGSNGLLGGLTSSNGLLGELLGSPGNVGKDGLLGATLGELTNGNPDLNRLLGVLLGSGSNGPQGLLSSSIGNPTLNGLLDKLLNSNGLLGKVLGSNPSSNGLLGGLLGSNVLGTNGLLGSNGNPVSSGPITSVLDIVIQQLKQLGL